MDDERLTRRECLARGAGAVLAAGAAAAGGYLLYDPKGDAGLPRPSRATLRLKNFFADVDFPAGSPRISVATVGSLVQEPPSSLVREPPSSLVQEPPSSLVRDSPTSLVRESPTSLVRESPSSLVRESPSSLVRESLLAPVEKLVRAAVGGLDPARGIRRFVANADVVLIKPNVGFDRPPHLGATTNPEVLRWVIRLCKEAGARKVVITDNPIEAPQACFARSGIQRVAHDEGAQVVLPVSSRFEVLMIRDRAPDWSKGEALGRWPILYEPLAEATKVIGVAPVKDHNLAGASMVLKNWYGLLGGRRSQLHQAIHETISDLALAFSPTLVIADATRVMMRSGPTGGRLSDVKPGGELGRPAVIASVDPVACDAWCYQHLLGRDPARLGYLELAHQKIQSQIAAGHRRFGERDWLAYERQGKIVTTSV